MGLPVRLLLLSFFDAYARDLTIELPLARFSDELRELLVLRELLHDDGGIGELLGESGEPLALIGPGARSIRVHSIEVSGVGVGLSAPLSRFETQTLHCDPTVPATDGPLGLEWTLLSEAASTAPQYAVFSLRSADIERMSSLTVEVRWSISSSLRLMYLHRAKTTIRLIDPNTHEAISAQTVMTL